MDGIGEYRQQDSEANMADVSGSAAALITLVQDDIIRDLRPMFPHLTERAIRETVVLQSNCSPDPTNLTRLMNSCIDQLLVPQSLSVIPDGANPTGPIDFVDLTKETKAVKESGTFGKDGMSTSFIDLVDSPKVIVGVKADLNATDKADVGFYSTGPLLEDGIETSGGSPKMPALVINLASSPETQSSGEDKGSLSDSLTSKRPAIPKEAFQDGRGITPTASSEAPGCSSLLHKSSRQSPDDSLMGSSGVGRKSHHGKSSNASSTVSRCPCSDCESTASPDTPSKHHSKTCQDGAPKPYRLPSPSSAPSFSATSESGRPGFMKKAAPESSPGASRDAKLREDEFGDNLRACLNSVDAALLRLTQMCKTPRRPSTSTKSGPSSPLISGLSTASGVSPTPRTDTKENLRPATVSQDLPTVTPKVGDSSGSRQSIHQALYSATAPSVPDSNGQSKYAASLSNQTCTQSLYKKPSTAPNQPVSTSSTAAVQATSATPSTEPGSQTLKMPPKRTLAATHGRPVAQFQQKPSHSSSSIAPSVFAGMTGAKLQLPDPPRVTCADSVKVDSKPATAPATSPTGSLAIKATSGPTVYSAGTTRTSPSTSRQQVPSVKPQPQAPPKITPASTSQFPNKVSKTPDWKRQVPIQESLGLGSSAQDPSGGHRKSPPSSAPKSGAIQALPLQNATPTRPTMSLPQPASRPVPKQPSQDARQPPVQFSGAVPKAVHGKQPSFAGQHTQPRPVQHPVERPQNQTAVVHKPPALKPNLVPNPQQQIPVLHRQTVAHQLPIQQPYPHQYPQQLPAQQPVPNPPVIVHQPPVHLPNPPPYPQQQQQQVPSVLDQPTVVRAHQQPNPQQNPMQQHPRQPQVPNPPAVVRQPPLQPAHQGGIVPRGVQVQELDVPPAPAVPQSQTQPAAQPAPIRPAIPQQPPAQLPAQVKGKSIQEMQTEVLILFPEVEPGYVLSQLEVFKGHPSPVNQVCNHLLENPTYPKAKRKESPPKPVPKENQGDKFGVIKHYYKMQSPVTYLQDTLQQLQHDFKLIALDSLRTVLALHHFHYAPTRLCLDELICTSEAIRALLPRLKRCSYEQRKVQVKVTTKDRDGKDLQTKVLIHMLKGRRHLYPSRKHPDLLEQVQLYEDYIKNSAVEKDRLFALSMNETEYEAEGQLIECGCCYGEVTFEKMVQCLDGHLFCESCLQMYAKQAVYGQGKAQLSCMTDGCDSSFPRDQLEKCLSAKDMNKYDERVQEESIQLAGMDGLVRCPHCDFAAVLDPGDKVFSCQNMDCMKETCRHCREDWKDHFGKRCEEIEKKAEINIRTSYEERMSKAQIRTCHKCKTGIMKDQGCNKMTCRCGAKMCYICRKPDIDYNHFCGHVRNPGQGCTTCTKCSLWTDPTEDDARAVKELEQELKLEREKLAKEVAAKDSRDRLGPSDMLPEAKKQRVF